jgi:hypothetical protein
MSEKENASNTEWLGSSMGSSMTSCLDVVALGHTL